MITTTDLINAALARGLRDDLPDEWFEGDDYDHNGERFVMLSEKYTGPDLTAPANLYELLRLADALDEMRCYVQPWDYDGAKLFQSSVYNSSVCWHGYGPDRTTAVLAACSNALGLEGAG